MINLAKERKKQAAELTDELRNQSSVSVSGVSFVPLTRKGLIPTKGGVGTSTVGTKMLSSKEGSYKELAKEKVTTLGKSLTKGGAGFKTSNKKRPPSPPFERSVRPRVGDDCEGEGQAMPSWLRSDFVLPTTEEEEKALAKEFRDVFALNDINLLAQKVPNDMVGLELLKRITHQSDIEKYADFSTTALTSQFGLSLFRIASVIMELYDCLVEDRKTIAELKIAKEELLLNYAKKATECEKLVDSLAEREDFTSVLIAEKASLVDRAGQAERLAKECWASLVGEQKRRAAVEEGLRVAKEAEQKLLRHVKQVNPIRIAAAIEDFKASPEQHELIVNAAFPYFVHGTNHILRMLAGHSFPGVTVEMMAEWALADPHGLVARQSHHLVPYNEKELQCLHQSDVEEGLPVWVPPTPLDLNVVSLVADMRRHEVKEAARARGVGFPEKEMAREDETVKQSTAVDKNEVSVAGL